MRKSGKTSRNRLHEKEGFQPLYSGLRNFPETRVTKSRKGRFVEEWGGKEEQTITNWKLQVPLGKVRREEESPDTNYPGRDQ